MKTAGFVLTFIGLLLFYLSFWVFGPYVVSLIPQSDWKGFFDFVVYFLIAINGGIIIPMVFIFYGLLFIIYI